MMSHFGSFEQIFSLHLHSSMLGRGLVFLLTLFLEILIPPVSPASVFDMFNVELLKVDARILMLRKLRLNNHEKIVCYHQILFGECMHRPLSPSLNSFAVFRELWHARVLTVAINDTIHLCTQKADFIFDFRSSLKAKFESAKNPIKIKDACLAYTIHPRRIQIDRDEHRTAAFFTESYLDEDYFPESCS